MSATTTNRRHRGVALGRCLWVCACLQLVACSKTQPKKETAAAPSSSIRGTTLPPGVDGPLYIKLKEIAARCDIDLRESRVVCKNREIDGLNEQFIQGARSQSKTIETMAYALAQADEKLVTVTAEVLHSVFRSPLEEKDPKPSSKQTALSLIKTLAKLPEQQAVDAAPATVYAALQTGTEKELYQAVENHPYKRLVSRTYRYLMAAGGMRAWDKVKELGKHKRVEVAMAALEAPSLLKQRSAEENTQICDWYRQMASDPRASVSDRASGYLIVCGPGYIERILAADEEALRDPKVNRMALNSYQQMCLPVIAVTGPTPEQCGRLKQLLISVLKDLRFETQTRQKAVILLTVNFPDQETLALLKRYAKDKDAIVSSSAEEAVKDVQRSMDRAAAEKAAEEAEKAAEKAVARATASKPQ